MVEIMTTIKARIDKQTKDVFTEVLEAIGETQTSVVMDVVNLYIRNKEEIVSIYNDNNLEPKQVKELIKEQIYGKLEREELEAVEVKESKTGYIVVASSRTVTKKLIEKGYTEDEITECPRLKQGLEFAWGIDKHLDTLSWGDSAILDGTVREGITTVLRRLRFAEPLRSVVKRQAEERNVQLYLETDKRRYRLADDLDFSDMLKEAVHKTWDGRVSQARNRPNGFSEYLQMALTFRSMPVDIALDEVISNMKSNGSYKAVEDIEGFAKRFCDRMANTYDKTHLSGYPISEFEHVLIREMRNITTDSDEFSECPMSNCGRRISKNDVICKRCQRATLEAN